MGYSIEEPKIFAFRELNNLAKCVPIKPLLPKIRILLCAIIFFILYFHFFCKLNDSTNALL